MHPSNAPAGRFGNGARASKRFGAFSVVDEQHVEIRPKVKFLRAEFAEPDHGERKIPGNLHSADYVGDHLIGNRRKLAAYGLRVRFASRVPGRHPDQGCDRVCNNV
jgi:hypothetical protein